MASRDFEGVPGASHRLRLNAQSSTPTILSIAKFMGFMASGRPSRGNIGPPYQPVVNPNIHLYGGKAPATYDLPCLYGVDSKTARRILLFLSSKHLLCLALLTFNSRSYLVLVNKSSLNLISPKKDLSEEGLK